MIMTVVHAAEECVNVCHAAKLRKEASTHQCRRLIEHSASREHYHFPRSSNLN